MIWNSILRLVGEQTNLPDCCSASHVLSTFEFVGGGDVGANPIRHVLHGVGQTDISIGLSKKPERLPFPVYVEHKASRRAGKVNSGDRYICDHYIIVRRK